MAQNELEKTLGKVIDEKITPRLKKLEEKLDATMEMVAKNSEDIEVVKIDVKEMQEDIADANFTSQRIESKLNNVIKDQDDMSLKTRQLNRRVLRLEAKKS